jgi:hypothetical protein
VVTALALPVRIRRDGAYLSYHPWCEMSGFREPALPARWLSPNPVPPDQPLHEASGEFASLLLSWLREGGEGTRLEWVVDAEPGGAVRTWLRCEGAAEEDIALLAAAAGEELSGNDPPPHWGSAEAPIGVNLGGPVAWRLGRIRGAEGPVKRARWLAQRGSGLRLSLRMWPLTPLRKSREKVERQFMALAAGGRDWQPRVDAAEHAERVLRGVLVELSVQPLRRLGPAERAVLTRAFQQAVTPVARFTGGSAPALAEERLAETLLQEFGSTRGETPEERESAAETARLLRTLEE